MDKGLIAWARRVKRQDPRAVPLWLFTDDQRLSDPLRVIGRLPSGLCGVVLRQDAHPDRQALARSVARLCRRRGVALILAGDVRLAKSLRAGLHLRGGVGGRPAGWSGRLLSASIHDQTQLNLAKRAGVDLIFISPVFPTRSHPGAMVLGTRGWHCLAVQAGRMQACALGGINARTVRRLPSCCAGIGAIEAFL